MEQHTTIDEATKLFLDHERLVYFTVRKYFFTVPADELEDVVSIGRVGLWKAALTYDKTKGMKFSTYATTVIFNEISNTRRTEYRRKIPSVSLQSNIPGTDAPVEDFAEDSLDLEEKVYLNSIVDYLKESPETRLYMEGYTLREISPQVGVSRTWANQRIHLRREEARKKFDYM